MPGLLEQVTGSVELAAVQGCIIFAPGVEGEQQAPSVRCMLKYCHNRLVGIAEYASKDGPFLVKLGSGVGDTGQQQVSIGDCVLFAILQYTREFFGFLLTSEHPRSNSFWDAFSQRVSTEGPLGTWDPELTAMTWKWIDL
jgi:hypothetical protein